MGWELIPPGSGLEPEEKVSNRFFFKLFSTEGLWVSFPFTDEEINSQAQVTHLQSRSPKVTRKCQGGPILSFSQQSFLCCLTEGHFVQEVARCWGHSQVHRQPCPC